MTLGICSRCNRHVKQAPECPFCGAAQGFARAGHAGWTALLMVAPLLMASCDDRKSDPPPREAPKPVSTTPPADDVDVKPVTPDPPPPAPVDTTPPGAGDEGPSPEVPDPSADGGDSSQPDGTADKPEDDDSRMRTKYGAPPPRPARKYGAPPRPD